MNAIPEKIEETIEASEIPDPFKALLIELLSKFGFEWIIELYECPETKGTGSPSISIDIFDMMSNEVKKEMQKAPLIDTVKECIMLHQLFVE